MTDEILFEEINGWGVVTLNRPKALNALTRPMVRAFYAKLIEWETHPAIRAVMVKGAGDRAFCAGGVIRWLHDTAKEDPTLASEFFREEYTNNALIYHFPKPYVAMIDGIVMGGGVGVSVHGDFRVSGDNTLFAMPETGIGLFPDVGGGHFMPRLHDGLGLYFALTGARAKSADCMAAGIATHFVESDRHDALEKALLDINLTSHAHADIEAVLDANADDPGYASVNDRRDQIKTFFETPSSLAVLMANLEKDGGQFASETLKTLSAMSPTSLALTFEQMKRGATLDFDDCMKMEFRIVRRVMEGHDFFEGVRAQIIDKDRKPAWKPATLRDDSVLENYFTELGDAELKLP